MDEPVCTSKSFNLHNVTLLLLGMGVELGISRYNLLNLFQYNWNTHCLIS